MFDEIDHNHDGKIDFSELHEALKRGQPNSEFNPNTVRVLIEKYDSDSDLEISFNEFYNLFIGLTNQFNEFLDYDQDFSGTIEANELCALLNNKGFCLTKSFYDFLFSSLLARIGSSNITFDIYVRVLARLEFLCNEYAAKNQNSNNYNLENYIKNYFFHKF